MLFSWISKLSCNIKAWFIFQDQCMSLHTFYIADNSIELQINYFIGQSDQNSFNKHNFASSSKSWLWPQHVLINNNAFEGKYLAWLPQHFIIKSPCKTSKKAAREQWQYFISKTYFCILQSSKYKQSCFQFWQTMKPGWQKRLDFKILSISVFCIFMDSFI